MADGSVEYDIKILGRKMSELVTRNALNIVDGDSDEAAAIHQELCSLWRGVSQNVRMMQVEHLMHGIWTVFWGWVKTWSPGPTSSLTFQVVFPHPFVTSPVQTGGLPTHRQRQKDTDHVIGRNRKRCNNQQQCDLMNFDDICACCNRETSQRPWNMENQH